MGLHIILSDQSSISLCHEHDYEHMSIVSCSVDHTHQTDDQAQVAGNEMVRRYRERERGKERERMRKVKQERDLERE